MAGYSALDRALHRLALGSPAVAEIAFGLDRIVSRAGLGDPEARHVFVCGLARSGTTALTRRLYASGAFASLTYRDMPFALAPNLWRALSRGRRKDLAPAERAHGDRIAVDADSPESLDEPFWRVFCGADYITPAALIPHTPDDELLARYRRHVAGVLTAHGRRGGRYLCKNNNNLLRLPALRRAFPLALILIPFREPAGHAASLMRQHRRFSALQREDRFARDYMRWLAHHEFGLDHRPFRLTAHPPGSGYEPEQAEYWLSLWIEAHEHLIRSAPEGSAFVSYEALCEDPAAWRRVATLAGIEPDGPGAPFAAAAQHDLAVSSDLLEKARNVYRTLAGLAMRGEPG